MMNPSSPPPSSSTTYQQQQHQHQQQPPRPSASPYHHPQHHHHQLPPPPPQQQHSPVNGYHHLPPHQQMQQHHPMEASGYHHHVDYHEAWRREQHQHRVLEEREREREREHHEAQRHAGHPVHYRQDGYDAAAYQHQPPHHAHAAHHPQLPSPPGRGHSRTQSRDTFLPPPLPPVRDDRQSPAMRFEPLKQRRSPSSGDWRDGREAQQQQHKRKRSGAYDQYGPGAWDHHQTYPPGYDYRAHAAAAAAEEEYYYHQHQRQQQEAAAAAAQHQQHQQQQHRQAQREREREGDRHHERERDSARPSAPPVQKAHRRTASVEQRKGGNKLPPPVSPSVMGAHAPPPPHHMASPYDTPQMLPHGRPATHEEMAMYEHSQMYGQHPPPPPHQQATANGSRHHDARRRHEHPQAHHELHHAPAINGIGGYDDRHHHRAPPSASTAAAAAAAMPPPPPPASHSHPEMVAAHAHAHGHDPHAMVAEPPAAMLPPPGGAAAGGAHPAHMRHPHQHPQHPPQHPMAPPIQQLQRHRVISDGVWHWLEENEAASSSSSSKDASAPPAPRIAGSFIYEPWATPLLPADLIVRNVGSLLEVRVPGHLLGAYREKSDARAREGWTLGWRARQHGCRVDLGEGAKPVAAGEGKASSSTSFWANRGLAERKVWGSEVYTDDSDVLGMCVHAGWIEGPTRLPANEGERPPQPNGVAHNSDSSLTPLYSPPDIRVLLRIAPRLIGYRESYAGGLWSRNWLGMHDGLSLVVEEVGLEPSGWAQKSKLPGARGVKSEAGRLGVLQRKVESLAEMEEDEEVTGVAVDEEGKPSAAGAGGGAGDRTASLFSLLTRSDSSLRKTVFPLSEVRTMAMQGKGKGGEDSTATGAAKKQHGREWYRLNQVVAMRG